MSSLAGANQAAQSFTGQRVQPADRLATTGGVVGSTAIAGLTLAGGIGWLMPKYGLALDNLHAADLTMVNGRILTKWDPDNFFRQNVSILPRCGEAS